MIKCDFCKREATHVVVTNSVSIMYVCDIHKEKVVNKENMQAIVPEPEIKATCSICGETKPIDDFYSYTDARGHKRKRSECKQCNLEQRKLNRLRRRK